MPVYQTTFEINAPVNRVWEVLTDFEHYHEWNPQIPLASGTLEEGSKFNLRLALPRRPAMDLVATLEQVRADSLLTWRGHVVAPWFFEGFRKFALQSVAGGRASVTHVEDIHGLLAPVFSLMMGGPVAKSHHALNVALRARAESSR